MVACSVAIASGTWAAESYPTRPVRIVVPFPAGGPVDITMRAISPRMSESLGQPIVIDNRSGAGGTVGADAVAKAAPDGHTLLACSTGMTINAALVPKLPYDFVRDFAPVTMVVIITSILVVHPAVPARSVQELIAIAKAKAGQLSYASTGNGTPTHLAAELFKYMAGVDVVHVPYKGGAPAAVDLIAGQGWHGLCAPARTARPTIETLYRQADAALRVPATTAHLVSGGAEPVGMPPAQFAASVRNEVAKWAKVIKATGMKAD